MGLFNEPGDGGGVFGIDGLDEFSGTLIGPDSFRPAALFNCQAKSRAQRRVLGKVWRYFNRIMQESQYCAITESEDDVPCAIARTSRKKRS